MIGFVTLIILIVVTIVLRDPIETSLQFTRPGRPETTARRPKTSVWISRVKEFQVYHFMEFSMTEMGK